MNKRLWSPGLKPENLNLSNMLAFGGAPEALRLRATHGQLKQDSARCRLGTNPAIAPYLRRL